MSVDSRPRFHLLLSPANSYLQPADDDLDAKQPPRPETHGYKRLTRRRGPDDMPIRYHAQRRHVIHSLETLLYQLHTLSFFLAPSLLLLVIRLATQHQFAGSRELEGRRPLGFWYTLVAFVNVGSLWTHAASDAASRAVAGEKSVVLDFVGMRHVPTKAQLLLLDVTIIFLQLILTTIAYETSLANVMPEDVPDPLAFINVDGNDCESGVPEMEPLNVHILTVSGSSSRSEEMVPFLSTEPTPPFSSTSSFVYPPPSSSSTMPSIRPSHHPSPSGSTPPTTSGSISSHRPFQRNQNDGLKDHSPLPPRVPILSLSLSHVIHRMSSPTPDFPARAMPGLTTEDDELAALQLPLPNTAPVRMARTIMMFGRAARMREQQRERDRQGQSGSGNGTRATSGSGVRRGSGETTMMTATESSSGSGPVQAGANSVDVYEEGRRSSERSHRIPGAIDEEEEDD